MATLILHTSTPSQFTFQPNTIPNPNFISLNLNFNKRSSRSTSSLRATHQDSNPQTPQDGEVDNLGVKAALSILRFYKREISPILPRSCRYVPTCSEYSMEAYKRYGVLKGTTLTVWRLCRCNPLGGSGYDPPRWFGEIRQGEELDD
ncbi:unnamed protein product [Lathyrus oleraceus]|uniref:Uncharacterized protein n=1 Tax=Pisum sativum TaxID=3888 RepID=A0A9D4VYB5_PEA|nr:UPF0161 protein At3g09310-like [Pisum sativum]XP_050901914.1 UPF0161 protein At3g09310-like [Pisum sativum]KAI5391752.1 hypothetical protein KIW84_076531 [Pisum sativum]